MNAYLNWLFVGALNCHTKIPPVWFAVIALLLALDWVGALKFTYLWLSENEAKHGKLVITPWGQFEAIFVGPLLEELVFRGPILWFCLNGDLQKALVATILGGIIFGLVHLTSKMKYADGTKIRYPWAAIPLIALDGLSFGGLVLVTKSLWPAIAFHGLLNLSITLSENKLVAVRLTSIARKWN